MADNRRHNTFSKEGWRNVEKKFNERAQKNYMFKQLRNKWDTLKSDWTLWNQLLRRETGLGWNHEKCTIDATPERWVALKAENKDYGKFEHRGLENTTELEIMFAKIVATGETAWTPVAGPFLLKQQNVGVENVVDLEEGSGDSDEAIHILTQTEGSSEKKKKNTIDSSITSKGKKVKSRGAAFMQRQLTRLCDIVESYTSASLSELSKKNYENSAVSIRECMELLLTLPEVEDGDEYFMLGTRLFVKRENREMFEHKINHLKSFLAKARIGKGKEIVGKERLQV